MYINIMQALTVLRAAHASLASSLVISVYFYAKEITDGDMITAAFSALLVASHDVLVGLGYSQQSTRHNCKNVPYI